MSKINVLPKSIANLIAAGEVIERPASVVKELLENSIDAGATQIVVEIKNGGNEFIRVTDNASGIEREDVEKAFLSHATSKIANENDLNFIKTLGFRGEALPSVAAVSKVQVLTKTKNDKIGTKFIIKGGEKEIIEEIGTPDGTTIIVKNLFYNTPARYKFLKTDRSEGNYVANAVDKIALSNPGISFKFIRDNRTVLQTSGDGKLENAIYSVFGKDFLDTLIPAELSLNEKKIYGFVSDPHRARKNRSMQHFFLNGRYIKNKTLTAALERAYEHSIMSGFFPACVLFIELPFEEVDVNVHPSKLEVRFQNEKDIFSFVYHSVKTAITKDIKINIDDIYEKSDDTDYFEDITNKTQNFSQSFDSPSFSTKKQDEADQRQIDKFVEALDKIKDEKVEEAVEYEQETFEEYSSNQDDEIKYIGEVFNTYLIAQVKDEMIIIDKHAAHEREIFNEITHDAKVYKQILAAPLIINCSKKEYDVLLDNKNLLSKTGFEIDDFGQKSIALRTCPSVLINDDLEAAIMEFASYLMYEKNVANDKLNWLYESIACRAAVKANDDLSDYEKEIFVKRILNDKNVEFCPHGRPVYVKYSKRKIEKLFGRIV